jgi:8-oxo-dGTP diphosphatase
MFVYDGGTLDELSTADIQLPPDELSRWEWCDETQIEQRMSQLLARRVIAALRAKAEGTPFDLENGFYRL